MKRFILSISCLFCVQLVDAQSQRLPVLKRPCDFFVGVNAFRGHYAVFFPASPNNTGAGTWQLTAGGNINRRYSVQMGYTYTHDLHVENPSYTGTDVLGQQVSGSSYEERHTHCIPVVMRCAAIQFPRPRLQVDVIVGLTWMQTGYVLRMEDLVNNQVVGNTSDQGKVGQLHGTAGLGLRYPFGRRVEGVFDWTYSRNFHAASNNVYLGVTGNKLGVTRAISLGLRYRFNFKQHVVAAAP